MAAPMWNRQVSPPPVASCSYTCYEIEEDEVISLKTSLQVLQTSSAQGLRLSSEKYTLSRLLYKSNNQQRHWRWYQMLDKIQKCLKKLQSTHPAKFIEDAICCCQINHYEKGCAIHLPSRQMLEYVLIKLMGQAKLCVYLLNMAESVFVFVVQNITSGQFLSYNMIYSSIVSRIWVMMLSMLKDMTQWYSALRPWLGRLKATSMQWMTDDEILPQNFEDWLKPDYDPIRYAKAIKRPSKKKGSSLLDSMFAAYQETADVSMTETPTKEDNNNDAVAMATEPPSLDLGQPVTAEEVAQKRAKVKLKRKRLGAGCDQEPATKKLRPEEDDPALEASGMHSSDTHSDDGFENRMQQINLPGHGMNETAGVDDEPVVSKTKKSLKKTFKQGIKKKLKKLTKRGKTEKERTPGDEAGGTEETSTSSSQSKHPEKKKFNKLKAKIQGIKKAKKSHRLKEKEIGSLGQDNKTKDSQQTKETNKLQRQNNKAILKRFKDKKKGRINGTIEQNDRPSPSKTNQKTETKNKKSIDARTLKGSLNDASKKPPKKMKIPKASLVCELGKISRRESKTRTNQTSDIDDIFACLEGKQNG